MEWFCAAETILNVLFSIKERNSHEYAKLVIESLVRKLYSSSNERESNYHPESMADTDNCITSAEGLPMKANITELHYSQLFYVVGHVCIKMLTYIEQMETDLKNSVSDSYNKKNKKQDEE